MSNHTYEQQGTNAPLTREAEQYGQERPRYEQDGGYGRQMHYDDRRPMRMGSRRALGGQLGSSETKPFYLTSEFLVTLMAVIATAITAATDSELSSRLAMALIAGLVAAYTLSRGIAKAGTSSHAQDPRESLSYGRNEQHQHEPVGPRS